MFFLSRLRLIFLLDATLLIAICALETVNFTGLILHEWLGLLMPFLILAHLLFSWTWIAATTRRLFSSRSGRADTRTRINYFLTLALFACITAQILSGILISQQAIPFLTKKPALALTENLAWGRIHKNSSDFAVALVSFHLAINWNWLAAAVRSRLGWRKAGAR